MALKRNVRRLLESGLGPRNAERIARAAQHATNLRNQRNLDVRRSNQSLASLKDKYSGQSCVIVGNGPSLNRTNLAAIGSMPVFALNRGYLKFQQVGRVPTFLVCLNRHVVEQFGAELLEVPCPLFTELSCSSILGKMGQRSDCIYLQNVHGPLFSTDPRQGVWSGATVTYVTMQLAYFLGFSRVALVGVDHRFSEVGPAHKKVTSDGPDRNHFDPNYFGPGVVWQLPDLKTSEIAYEMARDRYHQSGRTITDCTVDGALTVFPKQSLEAWLRATKVLPEGH